jgi:hypothetical protein
MYKFNFNKLLMAVVVSVNFFLVTRIYAHKQVIIFYNEEVIEKKTFSYRIDDMNGMCKKSWFINEKTVDEEQYQEQFFLAKKVEWEREQKNLQDQKLREYEFKNKTQRLIYQKLLGQVVSRIEEEIRKIENRKLEPFYVFEPFKGFTREQFDLLKNEYLPQAQAMLQQNNATLDNLMESLNQLENYPEHLNHLFQATIENALKKCDDTTLLKELLLFVS